MSITMSQKRIISLFKSFIEKVFVPQLSKMDSNCQTEWTNFSNMISGDSFNYGEVQLYVNTLPTKGSAMSQGLHAQFFDRTERGRNKSPHGFNLSRKESLGDNSLGFNPSKTFGGERAKIMMQVKQFEEAERKPSFGSNFGQEVKQSVQESKDNTISTLNVIPTLQKLFKQMNDNQNKIANLSQSAQSTVNKTNQGMSFEKRNFYK